MITLLRRVRRSSVVSGAFSKYFLYAVGEIALVVIGILIALQINNWNHERNNRKMEKEILTRIVQDLNTDLEEIALSSQFNELRILRGDWVLEKLGDQNLNYKNRDSYKTALRNTPNLDSLTSAPLGQVILQLRYYFLFEESNITIREITSTGKLDVIHNQDIKFAIQSHYAEITRYKRLQRLLITNRDELVAYFLENGMGMSNQMTLEQLRVRLGNFDRLIAQIDNFLSLTIVNYFRITSGEDSIKKRTIRLIEEIEEYLVSL